MGISGSDLAGIIANDARRGVEDCSALIDWLIQRVITLESLAGIDPLPRPELPSERAQRIFREMNALEMQRMRDEWSAKFAPLTPPTKGEE